MNKYSLILITCSLIITLYIMSGSFTEPLNLDLVMAVGPTLLLLICDLIYRVKSNYSKHNKVWFISLSIILIANAILCNIANNTNQEFPVLIYVLFQFIQLCLFPLLIFAFFTNRFPESNLNK